MAQGNTDKENRSSSTNVAPHECKDQCPVSNPLAVAKTTVKKTSKSTPTRNSLSDLPSGLPASTTARNSPRNSISRIPSSSSPSVNTITAKKPALSEKAAPVVQPSTNSQPNASSSTTVTGLKKPATSQASNLPVRTISPPPNTVVQPQQLQVTPQSSTGIPVPSSVSNLKKTVKKSSEIPKAAAVVPQKTQTASPVQPAAPQPAPAPVASQSDTKDPVAQLLARVKILEDTITTMKKEHKQEVSALRTRLTLVEQKLQAT